MKFHLLQHIYLLTFASLLLLASAVSAQEQYKGSDTLSVRIQGDSIVLRSSSQEIVNDRNRAIHVRNVPDSVVANIKADKVFEYANDPAFWKKEPPPDNSTFIKVLNWLARSPIVKWILYIFLAAIILFAIYQVIVVNDFFVFARKKPKSAGADIKEEELSASNLDELLENALQQKNYRLAVRYLYLKTLQLLDERKVIILDAKATNHDYVSQIKQHDKRTEFLRLTNIYEYAWYGEYALTDQQFDVARNNFNNFIAKQ